MHELAPRQERGEALTNHLASRLKLNSTTCQDISEISGGLSGHQVTGPGPGLSYCGPRPAQDLSAGHRALQGTGAATALQWIDIQSGKYGKRDPKISRGEYEPISMGRTRNDITKRKRDQPACKDEKALKHVADSRPERSCEAVAKVQGQADAQEVAESPADHGGQQVAPANMSWRTTLPQGYKSCQRLARCRRCDQEAVTPRNVCSEDHLGHLQA